MDKLFMKHICRSRSFIPEEFAILKPLFKALNKNAKLLKYNPDEECMQGGSKITFEHEEYVKKDKSGAY
jgi:hypothetical protein